MKTKIIALLIIMTMLLLSVVACSGGAKDPEPETKDPSQTTDKKDPVNDDQTDDEEDEEDEYESSYPWSKTTVIFCLSENSDSMQLPSSSRRYLAGDTKGFEDDYAQVDDYVEDRNAEAEKVTNVKATYQYLADTSKYGWGQCIDFIDEQVKSSDPEAPDVFVNFVYDMVAASLRGCFANLYSTTMYVDGHELAGIEHNYFEFVNDVMYADTGEDYMYNYMKSLTLSKFKTYCLSSDYFIDAVRAALVIPVNIELLEMLPNGETEYDYDENGCFSIDEFYELVWNMDWTYETLADLSDAITLERNGEGITLEDRVGFALGTSSYLPAAAMLYSSSINIIQRIYDHTKIDYTYSYPSMKQTSSGDWTYDGSSDYQIEAIDNFLCSLIDLVQHDGVVTISNASAYTMGYTGEAQAVRSRFANSNILFGGIITLGSLEYEEYLDMKGTGKKGYGIAPVPLYHSDSEDQYLTQIHNNGKIGAISYTTDKFSQCTAYLNYQSTNSNKVLEEYYNYKLKATVSVLGASGNTAMLTYIRENVRSSFDKAFEDALGEFYKAQTGGTSDKDKWHSMIKDSNFALEDMRSSYKTVAPAKAERLTNLETLIYPTLPN